MFVFWTLFQVIQKVEQYFNCARGTPLAIDIIQLEHPVRTLQGKLAKDERIIFQQKTSHSSVKSGIDYPQEVYVIAHPRDYKKNPPQGNELAHLQAFR